MKRFIAAALSALIMLSASGCTKLEQEHFDKSINLNKKGTALFETEMTCTIDHDALFAGTVETAKKLYEADEIDDEDILDSSDYLNDMRMFLDENKKYVLTLSSVGIADFDKNYSDSTVYAGMNGLTLNCGKQYDRGDTVYYDKRFAYTVGALAKLSQGGDFDELNEYFIKLDELFGDKKYICFSANGLDMRDIGLVYYEKEKQLLKSFNSGCVTKIPNGTRFELSGKDFSGVSKKFADCIKKNSKDTADFINDYLATTIAINAAMTGEETSELAAMADMFKISPADIAEAADSYKEALGSPGYKAFIDSFDIKLVNDITQTGDTETAKTCITVSAGGNTAVDISGMQTIEKTKKAEFEQIDTNSCVDYAEFAKLFSEPYDYDYDYDYDYGTDEDNEDPDSFEDYEDDSYFGAIIEDNTL